jgi:hypothetical protein
MKIEKIEKISKTKSFDSIKEGEVFGFKGHYYIKIETCCDRNAVNLSTGCLQYFGSYFEVEPCPNAILEIN